MSDYPYYSPARIKSELERRGAGIRKRWGQNFLIDPNHARAIAEIVLETCGPRLVEIGPGLGALTRHLLDNGRRVLALEIDPILVELLRDELGDNPCLELLCVDALAHLKTETCAESICGNLPYYITTDLLVASVSRPELKNAAFLTQTEFARRITAPDAQSSLGVFLSNFGAWKIARNAPPTVFFPAPKVSSSLVTFQADPRGPRCDAGTLEKLLRMSFGGKRKMISNSWKLASPQSIPLVLLHEGALALGLNLTLRPEAFSREEFHALADWLSNNSGERPA